MTGAQQKEPVKIRVLTDSCGPTPATVGLRDGLQTMSYHQGEQFHIGVRFPREHRCVVEVHGRSRRVELDRSGGSTWKGDDGENVFEINFVRYGFSRFLTHS